MPVLSEKHKFIFFQNPRTGSTMLEEVLMSRLAGKLFPNPESWGNRMEFKHLTYNELIKSGFISKEELNGYFKFVTVRNPYNKVVSDWLGGKKFYSNHRGEQTRQENVLAHSSDELEDYLKLILIPFGNYKLRRLLANFFPNFIYLILASLYRTARSVSGNQFVCSEMDLVIKTEELDKEFEKLCQRFSIKETIALPTINKTNQITKPHSSYHTELSKKLIYRMYKDLIDKFDYSFDE